MTPTEFEIKKASKAIESIILALRELHTLRDSGFMTVVERDVLRDMSASLLGMYALALVRRKKLERTLRNQRAEKDQRREIGEAV